ncbi:MAG TPA: GAF domain-containing protein [Candidatus Baltobacteraceae bacterium]|jgi:GAF domain-containing protein|nr:GAF domain-containing protein [Candidatus Baltobacteraceae bacterium]
MPSEQIGELKKWVAEVFRQGEDSASLPLNRAVELIGKNFGVQTHEVAILALTHDERYLRFLSPDGLRIVGQIPLTSTNALAARTAREKRPELINHFSVVPHASVFEGVPINETERGDPIQKIMSAPIAVGDRVIGVLQVSRKGKAAADAGADFTYPQLRELKTIADALAPCIMACNNKD